MQNIYCSLPFIESSIKDIQWFALETNRDHSVIFAIASSTAFQALSLTMMATPFLLRDFCPQ